LDSLDAVVVCCSVFIQDKSRVAPDSLVKLVQSLHGNLSMLFVRRFLAFAHAVVFFWLLLLAQM
jgi:hypothetical protein